MKKLSLVEKYDIALSYLFGVEEIDSIAEAKTYDGVVKATMKLRAKLR